MNHRSAVHPPPRVLWARFNQLFDLLHVVCIVVEHVIQGTFDGVVFGLGSCSEHGDAVNCFAELTHGATLGAWLESGLGDGLGAELGLGWCYREIM